MGMSVNVYLGPYIECEQETINIKSKVNGCPKCVKEDFHSKFCNNCGTKITSFYSTNKEIKIDSFEVSEEIKEKLHYIDYSKDFKKIYWVANVKWNCYHDINNFDGDTTTVEITPEQIKNEIDIFCKTFDDSINIITKHYGKIKIKYGLIYYVP